MREGVQKHVRSARDWAQALTFLRPVEVSDRKGIEALLHGGSRKSTHHSCRAKLYEQPLAAVLDRRKPRRVQGNLCTLDVSLVLPLDIRRHGLEASEANQDENLAQAVELNYGLDAVAALGVAPGPIGQAANMKVGIDRHVVAKALGSGKDGLQFDLLDGPLVSPTVLGLADRRENLIIVERRKPIRNPRIHLHKPKACRVVDDLQSIPELPNDRLQRAPPIRQREHADHLGKISVGRGADQQAARQITAFLGVPPEPWPRAAARAERVHLEQRGLVEAVRLTALAAHDEIGQITA